MTHAARLRSSASFPGAVTAPDRIAAAGRDFGGIRAENPAFVVRARNTADVENVLSEARARGLCVAARGQGHSTRGQAHAPAGIVVDMCDANEVRVEDGIAIAQAGARWDRVLRKTLEVGLSPPVLTDYLGLSVGGTLSVGGVGGQSFRHGLQVDQVEALRVVTGVGRVVDCSRSSEPELFDACRGGLGQCGLIVEARLRLIDAPRAAHVFRLSYRDLDAWLEDQARVAADLRFDYILGSILPSANGFAFTLEVAKYQASDAASARERLEGLAFDDSLTDAAGRVFSYADYALRLGALEAQMKADGSWFACHPWLDLFMPWRAAAPVIAGSLSNIDSAWLANSHTLTYPVSRPADAAPLCGLGSDAPHLLFGVGPTFLPSQTREMADFDLTCAKLLTLAERLGGRTYPIGFPLGTPFMDELGWRRHFGAGWHAFQEAKLAHDPARLLTPAPGVFPKRTPTVSDFGRLGAAARPM